MSINFVINSQLHKDSIIGAYTLFWDTTQFFAQMRALNIRGLENDLPDCCFKHPLPHVPL